MPLQQNPYVTVENDVIICDGPGRRHRGFPSGVRVPNGDVLVGYRVARDHWMTADDGFYVTRSTDNGQTWQTPVCVAAIPGWGVNGVLGQYPDGVMPADEPFLRAALQLYKWNADMPADRTWRENPSYWIFSHDYGDTWGEMVKVHDTIFEAGTDRGKIKFWGLFLHSNESTVHRLSDGRLMGLFVGRTDVMCYNPASKIKNSDSALAGFSSDNGMTWTFRTITDSSECGIGYSESDSVRLPSGRFVAIYGNNAGSPWFYETHSDDEGETWSTMKQLDFRGDSPSMIRLSNGTLLAAVRSCPEEGKGQWGIGIVASPDGGETWEMLGNVKDQTNWDMGYPDLVKLADGRILCIYYTQNECAPISKEIEEKYAAKEPVRTIFKGHVRPAAFGEIQSEIRGAILNDISRSSGSKTAIAFQSRETEDSCAGVPEGGQKVDL